jgi:hypothetical protein
VDYGASWQFWGEGIGSTPPAQLRELTFSADAQTLWVTDCGTPTLYRTELRRTMAIPQR